MKAIIDMLSKVQLKRDPWLVLLAVVLSIGCYVLVTKDVLTSKEALLFLGGVFALPSFFGAKSGVTPDDPAPPTLRTKDEKPEDENHHAPPSAFISFGSVFAICLVASMSSAVSACALFKDPETTRTTTKTTLTVLQKACVIANAAFPKSKVAEVCGIAGPLLDLIDDELLSARSAGVLPHRSYPVTCETTDTGIICVRPYVEPVDAGAR